MHDNHEPSEIDIRAKKDYIKIALLSGLAVFSLFSFIKLTDTYQTTSSQASEPGYICRSLSGQCKASKIVRVLLYAVGKIRYHRLLLLFQA